MSALALSWPALSFTPPASKTARMPEPAAPADEALVAATLAGDDEAFAELVRRHKRRVFGTASRFARDAHQLDDICQEVFVRAFRNLAKFRGDAPFEHWLARITVSACYDFLRKERRIREQVSLDAHDFDLRDTRFDDAMRAGRAREVLAFALARLSPEERLIITLAEIEERPMREIAALTGWSETNVKVRAFRARQSLKKVLLLSHES
ncbi:MAG: polymerase sigma-70 factor, subfamily [Chthoniobacter sp.]|jgi:RNA polymerase sigma-70 factor (ECF subfamily)|nr:polymerase sigma-70 factor, subfamily [Chthoniobacter sp.]